MASDRTQGSRASLMLQMKKSWDKSFDAEQAWRAQQPDKQNPGFSNTSIAKGSHTSLTDFVSQGLLISKCGDIPLIYIPTFPLKLYLTVVLSVWITRFRPVICLYHIPSKALF